MKAIILAAGRGSRMGAVTDSQPKCTVKIFGKTLLDHCLETLEKSGIERSNIGIVTGYRKEMICAEGVHFFYNNLWDQTQMLFSLTMAHEWLCSEPCIVTYSDIIFHENVVDKLINSKSEIAISSYSGYLDLWKMRFQNPFEDLETFQYENGELIDIGRKPSTQEEVQGQYMGMLYFEPSGWRKVEQTIKHSLHKSIDKLEITTLLQHMILLDHVIKVVDTDEMWLECDSFSDLCLYEKHFSKGISNATHSNG
ncbi:phosphocholine cytidylyltransferase family protein [Paenibacillus sp. IHBB 10380]|uniref:phosphocholine cytidylyltransferase family protein n=1 Tax=Paenibacillus sp. IHBB 10380 TaxID=1566358 RepID=UPI0005CFDB63|nr:phosphocholine cytidylyltransferase family protein [Paenibacillus sp. IHBB 10380]AJS57201.1 sugar nucleotidyltransferase [Paenibacillus sp. IHBB 10380]